MIAFHVVCVVVGLLVGVAVLLRRKGTDTHRMLGWLYVVAMLATAVGSFWIYEVRDGRPSIFHGVSVLITAVVLGGVIALRLGHRWVHALLMMSSFLMALITGIAQFFDQLPLPSPALNAIVFLQLPSVIGFWLIWRSAQTHRATASA